MARLGRYFIKDQPQHVIQRGIDRRAVFFTDPVSFCRKPRPSRQQVGNVGDCSRAAEDGENVEARPRW